MKLSTLQATILINTTYKKAWDEFSAIYPNLGEIPPLDITTNKSRIAGRAFWRRSDKMWARVELNLRFAITEGEDFTRTIYHELAHIVQYRIFPEAKQAHGPEFKSILLGVGQDESTYHSYSVSKAKSVSLSLTVDDL